MDQSPGSLSEAVNDGIARTMAIAGLVGIALIHVLEAPDAFGATTYLGLLFIASAVASLALSAILTRTSDHGVWVAAGGLAGLVLLGYVLSRTSGLPAATNNIGEWTEPLGLASLVAEGLVVVLTAGVLATRWPATGTAVAGRVGTRGRQGPGPQSGPVAPVG